MERYELVDGTSNKFWEIERTGAKLVVRWGKIGGTSRHERTYALASPDAAAKQHAKLVAEKTAKGYVRATKVKPTTKIAAKGRTHDVSAAPRVTIDRAKVATYLGLPVGPVLGELIDLCEQVRPDDPAEAFGLLGGEGALRFEIFERPHGKFPFTKQPKGVRAIASDAKNTFGLYATGATSSDDAPVTFEDVVGVEDPTIVAADLATWLSQLAFDGGGDDAESRRIRKNLQQHSAVTKARANAGVPDALAAVDLDATKPAPPERAARSRGKLARADATKAMKLAEKAQELRWQKSAKAAVPLLEQALALCAHAPYADENPRQAIELELLEVLVDAKQRAAAAALWPRMIEGWSAAGIGAQDWFTLATTMRYLKAKLDDAVRDRVRDAWARGRLRNILWERDVPSKAKPPADPLDAYDQAVTEIGLRKLARAKACMAVARKDDRAKVDLLEVMMHWDLGDEAAAAAAYTAALGRAKKQRQYAWWEKLAALYVLLGRAHIADPEEHAAILKGWKRVSKDAASAIFEA